MGGQVGEFQPFAIINNAVMSNLVCLHLCASVSITSEKWKFLRPTVYVFVVLIDAAKVQFQLSLISFMALAKVYTFSEPQFPQEEISPSCRLVGRIRSNVYMLPTRMPGTWQAHSTCKPF